jgi:hypothetical protein
MHGGRPRGFTLPSLEVARRSSSSTSMVGSPEGTSGDGRARGGSARHAATEPENSIRVHGVRSIGTKARTFSEKYERRKGGVYVLHTPPLLRPSPGGPGALRKKFRDLCVPFVPAARSPCPARETPARREGAHRAAPEPPSVRPPEPPPMRPSTGPRTRPRRPTRLAWATIGPRPSLPPWAHPAGAAPVRSQARPSFIQHLMDIQ